MDFASKASQGDAIEADQRTGTQLEPAHAQEEEEAKRPSSSRTPHGQNAPNRAKTQKDALAQQNGRHIV